MAAARDLVDREQFHAAIMDIHIRGERVFPLCDVLYASKVPFVFTGGHGAWELPDKWQGAPRLQKPYTIDQVREALVAALAVVTAV